MKVLYVSQELTPETGWGGIGTYVSMISRALAEKDIDVHVLSLVEGQPVSQRTVDGVTVHRFPLPQARHRILPLESRQRVVLAGNVVRLMRRLSLAPSVIECPDWKAEGLGLALGGCFPLVVRLHSGARQLFGYTRQGHGWAGLDGR